MNGTGAGGPQVVGVPVALTVAAMVSVQSGAAVATFLFDSITPVEAAWLRLSWTALILLALVRPALRGRTRRDLGMVAALGAVSAVMTTMYFLAIARVPLSTATALEFTGPLLVAALGLRRVSALAWPALAAAGVLALTRPWAPSLDKAGVLYALAAGAGWAGYIVLTQKVGDRFSGFDGLALSMTVGSFLTMPFVLGWSPALTRPDVLALSAVAAVLLPLLPYSLEMVALRRLTTSSFGTLMCLEPGVGALIGFALLSQQLGKVEIAGVILVCCAGYGAARQGARVSSAGIAEDPDGAARIISAQMDQEDVPSLGRAADGSPRGDKRGSSTEHAQQLVSSSPSAFCARPLSPSGRTHSTEGSPRQWTS